jgi:hypothetical protein
VASGGSARPRRGSPHPDLSALCDEDLEGLAREDAFTREILAMAYFFRQRLILDASDTEHALGVYASRLDAMIEGTLRTGTGNGGAS